MKINWYLIVVFALLVSCEDVIDVDLPEQEIKLVVNGVVRVDPNEEFIPVAIKFTETSGFFEENTIAQIESAVILVGERDPDDPFSRNFGTSVLEESEPGSGIWVPSYIPGTDTDDRIRTEFLNANSEFFLIVEHKGKRYAGQTFYAPTVPIDNLEQGTETLFNEDDTEIKVTFTDIVEMQNYYVFDFGFGNFLGVDDQFIDGQQFEFSYFYDEQLQTGMELQISILGADPTIL